MIDCSPHSGTVVMRERGERIGVVVTLMDQGEKCHLMKVTNKMLLQKSLNGNKYIGKTSKT